MNFLKQVTLFSVFLMLLACYSCQAQTGGYSITVSFEGFAVNDSIFLVRFEGNTTHVVASQKMQGSKVLIQGSPRLTPGMYAVGFKGQGEIAFLISEGASQKFTLITRPDRLTQTLRFEGSPENQAFADFQRHIDDSQTRQTSLAERLKASKNHPDTLQVLNEAYKQLEIERDHEVTAVQQKYPGSMLALFALAIHEAPIPEPQIPDTLPNSNALIMAYYNNYSKIHFFDNIPFSDPRIAASPLLVQKLDHYFKYMVSSNPDSVMANIQPLLQKENIHDDVYSQTVTYLYNLYRKSSLPEHSQVCFELGENYILPFKERFKDPHFLSGIEERTARGRLNRVGSIAADLKLITPAGREIRLSEVEATYTVLYFYNPGCEACGPVTDRLLRSYKNLKNKGMEVFAIFLDFDRRVWTDYITAKGLGWINVYDPDGREKVEEKYDIYAMPMLYLLDQDKKVIAKDISVEAVSNYILRAGAQ